MTGSLTVRMDDRNRRVLSCYDGWWLPGRLPTVCYARGNDNVSLRRIGRFLRLPCDVPHR